MENLGFPSPYSGGYHKLHHGRGYGWTPRPFPLVAITDSGCSCHDDDETGALAELKKSIKANPIAFLIGALAVGYLWKGRK